MWIPDNWPENPCDGCEKKDEDDWGLVCALTCHKGANWRCGQMWAEWMQNAMIARLEQLVRDNPRNHWGRNGWRFAIDLFKGEE